MQLCWFTGGHLKLQAEFGARSSGPEQIHDTAIIVTGINSVGPRFRSKERPKVAFRSTYRIHARITPMSHTYNSTRLSKFAND
ncbi:unnamed protein product [Fusarium venenatum]|uniref:Uncharacterized protein n=1 Tax=Fusarium venenatum TaxID=56646 RepID=A0A2L2TWS3_9HYPO|nr:uncharacterized protein FVRRES_09063 [Fusarium venenatum]CEI68986.1 unnamed protein product [Fusarium venenatum]